MRQSAVLAVAAALQEEQRQYQLDLARWTPPVQQGEEPWEAQRNGRFWRSLRKKVSHGPAVRIRDGYDSGRRGKDRR